MMRPAFALAAALGLAAPALAQESPDPADPGCAAEEYRQLDFWVGDWSLAWTNPDGTSGEGHNEISLQYRDCVVYEQFSAPEMDFYGMSVSTYDAPLGVWRQTWVDDQGGYIDLVGGPAEGEAHDFEMEAVRLTDDAPHMRMIWQDVTDDSLTWRWQGRDSGSAAWEDRWVIRYQRAGASG